MKDVKRPTPFNMHKQKPAGQFHISWVRVANCHFDISLRHVRGRRVLLVRTQDGNV